MLRTLRVSDLAIIDEIELLFEPGFNVLTGETGAGKSILLHALDVTLGGRPDADLVRGGAEEAVVEALFTEVPMAAWEQLDEAGIRRSNNDELVIRRVIAAGGRSRAYVNGSLANLALLREIAPRLIRVYGQDEHQALRRVEGHREMLDAVGGLGSTIEEMRRRYVRFMTAKHALDERRAVQQASIERAELLRFQLEELTGANLQPGEEDLVAADRGKLLHAEKLATLVNSAEASLYSGDSAAVESIGRALTIIREAERIDAGLAGPRVLLESCLAELEEASGALSRYSRTLRPDPAKLDMLEERLAELARLKRKFGGTIEDLVKRRDELRRDLNAAEAGDEALHGLVAEVEAAEKDALAWAKRLAVDRRRVAHSLERSVATELHALALEGARFQVRFADGDDRPLSATGWDEVEFYLAANPGEELRPLARVASGGELSRIMLALKTLTAAEERSASLIFDEVDAGVGGAVAEVIGRKLRQLGVRRQVLSVTHLPVIAAFADHHIGVTKHQQSGRTVSSARPLSNTERVAELARMLGGQLTREAREHAEQLLRLTASKGGRAAAASA
ncbi:MAG TPA: DNA repair protein RecN [Candidatus Eisenbacteria bacterium]|nr:DNA repair protein RecN [Candidatus Eisenbacteria bacterium]